MGRQLHRSFMETKFHDEKFEMLVTVLVEIRNFSPTLSHQHCNSQAPHETAFGAKRCWCHQLGGINRPICHQHLKLVTDISLQHRSPTSVIKIDLAYYERLFGKKNYPNIKVSRFDKLFMVLPYM